MGSNLKKLFLLVVVRHLNRSAYFIYHDEAFEEEEGGEGGEEVRVMKNEVYHVCVLYSFNTTCRLYQSQARHHSDMHALSLSH